MSIESEIIAPIAWAWGLATLLILGLVAFLLGRKDHPDGEFSS
jgi:hypothetical protein